MTSGRGVRHLCRCPRQRRCPQMRQASLATPVRSALPPEIDTVEPLAALVPTQLPPGVAAVRPAGSVSVKAAPVMAVAVGLLKVMVSVAVAPIGIMAGLNTLAMAGRATFKVALVPTAFGPMLDVTPPTAIVLV